MKKLFFKIISLLVLFVTSHNINAQRNVAWVHGFGGDSISWKHYEQIFTQERNINSLRTKYNTSYGIDYAANEVKYSVDTTFTNNANNPQNMGIGHSMGGLMIRDVDRLTASNNKKFGGYITVTSPNYGAPIANSLTNGSVQSVAANACNKLSDGPLSQLFNLPWAITPNLATNVLCNKFINNDLIQDMVGAPLTVADLKQGSPIIETLKTHTNNSTIPKISIWGRESTPVHWRLFSTDKFPNDTDQKLVNYVNTARFVYNAFYVYNVSLAIACGVGGFWNPVCWGITALASYRATQWVKGRNWIDDSENIWSSLIKTTRMEQQTYWVYVWVPCDYPPQEEKDEPIDCGEWQYVQHTRWVSVNYPSDGLLPQYTQELTNIPQGNRYKVLNANHLEVRNMTTDGNGIDETKVQFDLIFNRPQNDWFHTPLKP